jgi:glycosidase
MGPFFTLATLLLAAFLTAATAEAASALPPPPEYTLAGPLTTQRSDGPEWARNLPIYQAYPHDGWGKEYVAGSYFRRTEALLPALKEMGVGVVWLVPVHPRGPAPGAVPPPHIAKTAQFQSQSPYCVRDYYAVDPHWGSPEELKHLIQHAHTLGMRVMLDMVLNHTSWGNPLLVQHPDFYKKDADGNISQAGPWADIAQLDYANHAVWDYMRDMLVHWTRDYGVDGFRMDAADRVPSEFWSWLRPQLLAVRPVLLLAEDEAPADFPAFDMAYEWRLKPLLWALAGCGVDDASSAAGATALDTLLLRLAHDFPPGAVLMNHLDNHDIHQDANPWTWGYGPVKKRVEGHTVLARYGDGYRAFSVLAATLPGRPMLYNSQEAYTPGDLEKPPMLDTPEKLRAAPNYDFYRRLLNAYQQHPALYEGVFTKVPSNHDEAVYSFLRVRGSDKVLVVLNLSPNPQTAVLHSAVLRGSYKELFTGKAARLGETAEIRLEAWGYRVYVGAKK